MSAYDSAGYWDTMTPDSIGPQMDGTNLIAQTGIMAQPADTAGGQPANYGQGILDLFKFGISTAAANQQQQQFFDYKKFEATNGGLYQQGNPATMPRAAQAGGVSQLVMLGLGAVLVFAVLTHKG